MPLILDDVLRALETMLSSIPGLKFFMQPASPFRASLQELGIKIPKQALIGRAYGTISKSQPSTIPDEGRAQASDFVFEFCVAWRQPPTPLPPARTDHVSERGRPCDFRKLLESFFAHKLDIRQLKDLLLDLPMGNSFLHGARAKRTEIYNLFYLKRRMLPAIQNAGSA